MKCLCRFFLRLRGAHDPTRLHALRPVSLYFLKSARFLKNINIWDRGLERSIAGLLLAIFETSGRSRFCDAFVGSVLF
jgi:hypothetical protein